MNKLEKKDFYKELLRLAIPIGLQNLLVALIGATDALMLGRLSQDAVAAVSLANQIVFVMNLFVFSIIGGCGALIAQYWGKQDKIMVKNLFCFMLKCSFAIAIIFFALAMLIPEQLMRIYTPEESLIKIGASYLRAVSVSYVFTALVQCYYTKMKVEGKASISVIISIVTLVVDVVLDFLLIYGYAGAPKLGADGAAYTTVAVEFIAIVWCVVESYKKDCIHVDFAGFKWFSKDIIKDFLKIFVPSLGSALAWGLSITIHSLIMGHLGSDATAASSITSVVFEVVSCLGKGVSAGTGIIVGKLLGQNLLDKAKSYGRKFCHISFALGGIHILLLCILGPVATIFFVLTETARQYLIIMLIFTGFYVFAYSINTVVVCGIFPAGGDSKYDAISVFIATWCIAIPLALIGAFVFNWPVILIYIIMCIDEIIKVPFIYPRYKKHLWVNNLTRDKTI